MISAVVSDLDGTDRLPLDELGGVTAVTFASGWPAGDTTCSIDLARPVAAETPTLGLGRKFTLFDGLLPVWGGILTDPQRGSSWQLTASGLQTLGNNYVAKDSSGSLTTNANTAVTQAISRGLPWTVPTSLPTPTVTVDSKDVNSLLDAVALASSMRWAVDPLGQLTMTADPTVPSLLMVTSSTPGGRTLDGFATDLYALYGTNSLIAASNNPASTAPRPYGRVEAVYDTTPGGSLSSTAARTMANGALAKVGPDPSFTGSLTVQPGDLQTMGGQPVRLSTVRAGQMVRCLGVQPDPASGQTVFSLSVNVTIGGWEVDAVAGTAQLTPLGAVPRDLSGLLAAPAAT